MLLKTADWSLMRSSDDNDDDEVSVSRPGDVTVPQA